MTHVALSETQSLAPSAVLELFVLDATVCGGPVLRFHAGTNALGTSVVWQGLEYSPLPVQADGFEMTSKGTLPRPKIRLAAMDGVMGGLVAMYQDLVGAKVTLKKVFAKHLDAVNFPGGVNLDADPTACWPDEPWIVERKSAESKDIIEFELTSPMDVPNAQIPKRRVMANVCGWQDASICVHSVGGACTKTLAACKTHWADAELPFGGFPGTARVR